MGSGGRPQGVFPLREEGEPDLAVAGTKRANQKALCPAIRGSSIFAACVKESILGWLAPQKNGILGVNRLSAELSGQTRAPLCLLLWGVQDM